jgi:RNA polymerase sigma factor (sigma-70 family)
VTQVLPERFQGLFREHYPTVLRRLNYLVGDRAIAEDLAQEVFLRLYRSPPDDLGVVGPWLHRVSTRVVYDYTRKKSAQKKLETNEFAIGIPDGNEPSSELHVLKRYERETVKHVLQQLSERDRQVLLLRYSGYSYTEIAEIVQVNPKIVGTMLNRALSRFERKYHDEEARADEG